MLIAYIISVVVCFVFCVLASKYHDGEVTVGDVLLFFGIALIPGFNILAAIAACVAFIDGLYNTGIFNKKIW